MPPKISFGDLVRGARLPPDDLKDRAQATLVMPRDGPSALRTVLEGTPVSRKHDPRRELLDLPQRLEVLTQGVARAAPVVDMRSDASEEVVARYEEAVSLVPETYVRACVARRVVEPPVAPPDVRRFVAVQPAVGLHDRVHEMTPVLVLA